MMTKADFVGAQNLLTRDDNFRVNLAELETEIAKIDRHMPLVEALRDEKLQRLTADHIAALAHNFGNEHHAQPSVVSITQSTEMGTVYTPDEVNDICTLAHSYGMAVHVDGARLANAAASLEVPLRTLTTDAGVDVISLGGTKSGLLFGELVVVLDPARAAGIRYIRKYTMQLAAKMRFISAQFVALLDGDLWRRGAERANAQAALLRMLKRSATPRSPARRRSIPTACLRLRNATARG